MVVEKRRPSLASMGTQAAERTPDGPLRPGRNARVGWGGGPDLPSPYTGTGGRGWGAEQVAFWGCGHSRGVGERDVDRPARAPLSGPHPGPLRGWRVLRQPRYPHRKACFGTMNAERAGSLSHRGVSILWTQVLPEGVSGGRLQG